MTTDHCQLCKSSLCTATWKCGNNHRSCLDCFTKWRETTRRRGEAFTCAVCRQEVDDYTDSKLIQHHPTTLQSARESCLEVAVGVHCNDGTMIVSEEDTVTFIREALSQAQADGSATSYDKLRKALRKLSMEEYELVFTELVKTADLHQVLQEIDKKQYAKKTQKKTITSTVISTITDPNRCAIEKRAVISSCVQTAVGMLGGAKALAVASVCDFGVGAIVFSAYACMEIQKWRKGNLGTMELLKNIGEHAVGCTASTVGSITGAIGGMALVTLLAPAAAPSAAALAIGAFCGSVATAYALDSMTRKGYRWLFPAKKETTNVKEIEEEIQLSIEEKAGISAKRLKINLTCHSFVEAKKRYRKLLVAHHPDRFQGQPEAIMKQQQAKVIEILSDWAMVRLYYKEFRRKNEEEEEDEDDVEGQGEAYVQLNVLRKKFNEGWKYVRTWFGDLNVGGPIDKNTEEVSTIMVYV